MSKNTVTIKVGEIFFILTVFLILLKVTGLANISWLVALFPILLAVCLLILMWLLILLIFIVVPLLAARQGKLKKNQLNKKKRKK